MKYRIEVSSNITAMENRIFFCGESYNSILDVESYCYYPNDAKVFESEEEANAICKDINDGWETEISNPDVYLSAEVVPENMWIELED